MVGSGAKVTAFLRGEDQLKQDWLCMLMADERAPLDVCYKTNIIRIDREFYPYAVYGLVCRADWSATSYWEHTETYQEPRTETVYIDYMGREHKDPGRDFEVKDSEIIDHYREPKYKTVYNTKKKTVIDDVQDTYGSIDTTRIRKVVWTGPVENQAIMMTWVNRFNESQFHPVSANGLPGIEIPEVMSAAQAQQVARDQAADALASIARKQVPGNRYENFSISSFNVISENRTTCYLSTYHVYYEYEGKQYDCILTGGNNTSDVVINDRPVDHTIKTHADSLDESIKQNSGCLLLGITIATGILGVASLLSGLNGGGLVLIGAAAFCGFRYKTMSENRKAFEAQKAQFITGNTALRQQIYDLIQNDSIPEEQKGPMIEQWVNQYKASIDS